MFHKLRRFSARVRKRSNWHGACSHLLVKVFSFAMSRFHPNCDRHTNLQMVCCWVKRPQGITSAHICPVPGCGRYNVDGIYLAARDVEIALGPKAVASAKSTLTKGTSNEVLSERPLNRQAAARAAILRAIQQKQPQ